MEFLLKNNKTNIKFNIDKYFIEFGNKELRLDIPKDILTKLNNDYNVEVRYKDSSTFIKLLLLDSVLEKTNYKFNYVFWYLPYSRMDRIKDQGTAFSLKIIAELINNLKSKRKIYTLDSHSDVSLALINNIEDINSRFSFAEKILSSRPGMKAAKILVFPDSGARKRFGDNKFLNTFNSIIVCEKTRDFNTGKILNVIAKIEKSDDMINYSIPKEVYIIDDICSYGGTFIAVKKAVKELLKKSKFEFNLIVTHTEDVIEKGEVLKEYNEVFTTDSLITIEHPKINILNLSNEKIFLK
jgi:phosphoribosyltransferase